MCSSKSKLRQIPKASRFTQDFQAWFRGGPLPPDSPLSVESGDAAEIASLTLPVFGEITSISPRAYVQGSMLSRFFLGDTFVTMLVAILFGVPVPVLNDLAPLSAPLTILSSGAVALYIFGVVWATRIFQLMPYWRYREPKPSAAAPQSSPAQAPSS